MLTDRQRKFYDEIARLSLSTSTATDKERKYLLRAKRELDSGNKFSDSINALDLSLRILTEDGNISFTREVGDLWESLVETYGEPDFRTLNSVGGVVQTLTTGGVVTVGGKERNNSSLSAIIIFLVILVVASLLFAVIFTRFPQMVTRYLGKDGLAIIFISLTILVVLGLIFSGKQNSKKE